MVEGSKLIEGDMVKKIVKRKARSFMGVTRVRDKTPYPFTFATTTIWSRVAVRVHIKEPYT